MRKNVCGKLTLCWTALTRLGVKYLVFVFLKYRKSILYLYIKYTVDQVYLYLAMYRVFVFVIGILMLVFDPSLPLTQSNGGN